ncbi:hypothetical protein [Streptomyces huiliensis]|uniref:hypothetical protein n=1 Tax=Streptomyces huiliensis TaxID=2876027 RepID=UPI001CC177CC|nr:hypothetical protein [Streptomyces huiliensis]MBZ4322042.1 hypothetical protein [Streptomyces huiliensis]
MAEKKPVSKGSGPASKERGLAGTFSWDAGQDDGLLANAAREGMGYEVEEKKDKAD